MARLIAASQLYNHLTCPHRVTMDVHGDPALREPPNAFVELLWQRGSAFERETVAGLRVPFTDLSALSGDEKERATREAMDRGDALIYNGRLSVDELLGEPDLLRRDGTDASGRALYVAIDIKSGAGEEGGEEEYDDLGQGRPNGVEHGGARVRESSRARAPDSTTRGEGTMPERPRTVSERTAKPKRTYGVQVALYTDILIRLGVSAGRHACIWDVHGNEVRYELDAPLGVKTDATLWSVYLDARRDVAAALERAGVTRGASSSACKLCVWRTACLGDLKRAHDLTLLPELGRARRDVLVAEFATLEELAGANVERYAEGKKTRFPGVGPDMLRRFQARARLAVEKEPTAYLKQKIELPTSNVEMFFDIETDPMRDLCYLHGFVIRKRVATAYDRDVVTDAPGEEFLGVFAEGVDAAAEKQAFASALAVLRQYPTAVIYIYSKYERTIYRQLAARYPDVCSVEEIEALFASGRTVDLYGDVVRPYTEFPTLDFSIKSIAKYLGFQWRDTHPSGAASIEWFQRYVETGDAALKQRILDYNEDDCIAMRVLVDAIPTMRVADL